MLDGDNLDEDASDTAADALYARRTVGAEILAEAALSIIAIRKAMEKKS